MEGFAFAVLAALLLGSCATATALFPFRTGSQYASDDDYKNAQVDFSKLLFVSALIPAETINSTTSTPIWVDDFSGLRRIKLVDGNAGSVKVTVLDLSSGEMLDSYTLGGALGIPPHSDFPFSGESPEFVGDFNEKDLLLLVLPRNSRKLVAVDLMGKHLRVVELGLRVVELRACDNQYWIGATLSPNNSFLATVGRWGCIRVWQTATGSAAIMNPIALFLNKNPHVMFSTDEQYLFLLGPKEYQVGGQGDVIVSLWDLRTGIEIRRVDLTRLKQYERSRRSSDSYDVFMIPGNTDEVMLFDGALDRIFRVDLATLSARPLAIRFDTGQPTRWVFDSTSRYLVLGDQDGFLTVYDLAADTVIDRFRAHYDERYSIAYCDAQAGVFATYHGGRTWLWALKAETVPSVAGPLPLQRAVSDSSQSASSLQQVREKYRAAKTEKNGPLVSLRIVTSSVTDVEKSQIVTALQARLLSAGELKLVENDDLDIVLREIEQSLSGLYSESTQVRLGRFLFADKIIFGALIKVDNLYIFNSKLINVENGQVLAVAYLAGNSVDAIIGKMPEMVQAIAAALRAR